MTNMTVSVTVTKDGQINIPKKMRRVLSLSGGQAVTLRSTRRGILIETARSASTRLEPKL